MLPDPAAQKVRNVLSRYTTFTTLLFPPTLGLGFDARAGTETAGVPSGGVGNP